MMRSSRPIMPGLPRSRFCSTNDDQFGYSNVFEQFGTSAPGLIPMEFPLSTITMARKHPPYAAEFRRQMIGSVGRAAFRRRACNRRRRRDSTHDQKLPFISRLASAVQYQLVRAGRRPEELAKEFEPSAHAIRNWLAQPDREDSRRLTTADSRSSIVCGVRTANSNWSARFFKSCALVRSGDGCDPGSRRADA